MRHHFPATLYGLTKRLASVLSLPLTLHSSLAPGLAKKRKYDPNAHQMDNVPVEVSFMASCIIVLKMVYGLDGTAERQMTFTDE